MKRKNILVVYSNAYYPLRSTLREHLFCFKKYSNDNCFYFNADTGKLADYLVRIPFDLIIFPTAFISSRWKGRASFEQELLPNVEAIKKINCIKILLPQDEWIFTNLLCEFIQNFRIDLVFSTAAESEWHKIYAGVDFKKVKFERVLTGYLDEQVLQRIGKIVAQTPVQTLDIGYRAARIRPWLGSHGYLKTAIAGVFIRYGDLHKLRYDISLKYEDTLFGDNWFEFLARSRYTIGVEGGAGIIDPEGKIMEQGMAYEEKHPEASFEEFEKNCFPGMDNNLHLVALSPRHLEACATHTCQILIEGDYNGILKRNLHYIPLKKDFSNMEEVIAAMGDEEKRKAITERAFEDIIASKKYTYQTFVSQTLQKAFEIPVSTTSSYPAFSAFVKLRLNRIIDRYHVMKITDQHPVIVALQRMFVFFGFRTWKKLLQK